MVHVLNFQCPQAQPVYFVMGEVEFPRQIMPFRKEVKCI